MRKATIVECIALAFAFLLLFTGGDKIRQHDLFIEQLKDSPLLNSVAGFTAWGLPVTEFLIALLLFIPATRRKGLYATLALMSLFTVYIVILLSVSPETPCSCMGLLDQLTWPGHLIFNGACIALAVTGIWLSNRPGNKNVQSTYKTVTYSIVLLCLLTLSGCKDAKPSIKAGLEGKSLPSFAILLQDSSVLNTSNITAGKPFAIFYFSPQCPYCRAQTKTIVNNIEDLQEMDIYMVSSYSLPAITKYVQENGLSKYKNIITGKDTANFIASYYEVPGVPFIAVYDGNKKLNKAYLGQVTGSKLKNAAFPSL